MRVNRVLKTVNKIEKRLMGIIFMVLTVLVVIQVCQRALGLQSFSWLDEFSQLMFICVAFCGASVAVTEDSHMKIRLLESILPERAQQILQVGMNLVCGAASLYVMKASYDNTVVLYRVKSLSAVMDWQMWIIYAVLTICLAGMALRFFLRAIWPMPRETKE